MSPRARVHDIGSRTSGIETESPLLSSPSERRSRSAERGSPIAEPTGRGSRCSAPWSSACGTRGKTRRTTSGTSRPARCGCWTGSSTTRLSIEERRNHFAYFACSEEASGFDTQREAFLGPYRGWERPTVVEVGSVAELDRQRLGADRRAPGGARAGAEPDAGGRLPARLRGEPAGLRSSPLRDRRGSTAGPSSR